MNPELKILKSIDPNLIAEGYTNIAQIFKCYLCFMIPLNFYRCANKRCEAFICIDCKTEDRCLKCDTKWQTNSGKTDINGIHDLINLKCPNSSQGCSSVCKMIDIKSHYTECSNYLYNNSFFLINPNHINDFPPINLDLNNIVKNNPNRDDGVDKNQSKEEQSDSDSSSEEMPRKFRLKKLKKDSYVVLLNSSELQEFEKDELRDALIFRELDTNGTKAQLADKLLKYSIKCFYTDKRLIKFDYDKLESLSNFTLEEILGKRDLKKSGNKSEKIKNLNIYLKNKLNQF